jgi:phage tail-like protein
MTDRPSSVLSEFRFTVEIDGMNWGAFTECTLPIIELETEQVKEGGLNAFVHTLPLAIKPSSITLKNGLAALKSLNEWTTDILQGTITRKSVTVKMLDLKSEPYMTITLKDAFPTKWTGPQLRTDSTMAAVQSIEFAGGELTVEIA